VTTVHAVDGDLQQAILYSLRTGRAATPPCLPSAARRARWCSCAARRGRDRRARDGVYVVTCGVHGDWSRTVVVVTVLPPPATPVGGAAPPPPPPPPSSGASTPPRWAACWRPSCGGVVLFVAFLVYRRRLLRAWARPRGHGIAERRRDAHAAAEATNDDDLQERIGGGAFGDVYVATAWARRRWRRRW